MEPTQTNNAHNIVIYSTPNCTYCKAAKEYLTEHKVGYTEVDLAAHPERIGEIVEKSGQKGVPVILVDDQVLVGFDESELGPLVGIEAAAA